MRVVAPTELAERIAEREWELRITIQIPGFIGGTSGPISALIDLEDVEVLGISKLSAVVVDKGHSPDLIRSVPRLRRVAGLSVLLLAGSLAGWGQTDQAVPKKQHGATSSSSGHKTGSSAHHKTGAHSTAKSKHGAHRPLSAKALAKSRSLHQAFVASSQLRPMAQQLTQMRSPAAYAGVTAYAQSHTGEAASAAYLSLGHAYLEDKKYPEALTSLHKSGTAGQSLSDYADYLGAQANLEAKNLPAAELLLNGFATRHPDSIFVPEHSRA